MTTRRDGLGRATTTLLATLGAACASVQPEADGWQVSRPDAATTVRWQITEFTDDHGATVLRIHDEAETTVDASIDGAIAVFLNVPCHTQFLGVVESRIIKEIAADQWLVYSFVDNPWPIEDADRVSELTQGRDESSGAITFNFVATPDAWPAQAVQRQRLFNVTYTLTALGDGRMHLREEGESTPPVAVPRWLVESAFPGVAFNSIRKLASLIEGKKP